MMVRYYFENGYSGCDQEEVEYWDNDTPSREIDNDVNQWGYEHAESYSYVHFGWDEGYSEEDYEDYIENYCGWGWHKITWEEYVEYCENWGIKPNEEWKD